MGRHFKWWVLIFPLLALLAYWSRPDEASSKSFDMAKSQSNSSRLVASSPAQKETLPQDANAKKQTNLLTPQALRLIQFMLSTAAKQSSLSQLVDWLKSSGQQPQVTFDENPHTGKMTLVRSQVATQSVRYVHAQYLSDATHSKEYLQHISFDIKSEEKVMSALRDNIHKLIGPLGVQKRDGDDYLLWELPNGYILWAKPLTWDELQDDPFNAYTHKDVGTIRVTLEQEIHFD